MRGTRMLGVALGVEGAVIEDVRVEADGRFVVRVHARGKQRGRCGVCLAPSPGYDAGEGLRCWRTHDVGIVQAYVEAAAPRVECATHGVVVSHAPWARHGSGFTRSFEDTAAWLAMRTDKTTLSGFLRIAWRTVGSIIERVTGDALAKKNPLLGVTRIGIDEVSYRKGHRYVTVVMDHDTGRMIWAAPGRSSKTLAKFFRLLGKEGRAAIKLVSADAASWIGKAVRKACPNAALCIDPFHVVQWATKALDEVRREMWNELRRKGDTARAKAMKGSRWSLVKNPEDLTRKQKGKLRTIEKDNQRLYRAYLLKEQLRDIFKTKGYAGVFMLDAWLAWAGRSQLEPFKKVATTIRANRIGIDSALAHGLSNGKVESMNNRFRLLTRLAYGFHSPAPLIDLAMLKLGGLCPPLPYAS